MLSAWVYRVHDFIVDVSFLSEFRSEFNFWLFLSHKLIVNLRGLWIVFDVSRVLLVVGIVILTVDFLFLLESWVVCVFMLTLRLIVLELRLDSHVVITLLGGISSHEGFMIFFSDRFILGDRSVLLISASPISISIINNLWIVSGVLNRHTVSIWLDNFQFS